MARSAGFTDGIQKKSRLRIFGAVALSLSLSLPLFIFICPYYQSYAAQTGMRLTERPFLFSNLRTPKKVPCRERKQQSYTNRNTYLVTTLGFS